MKMIQNTLQLITTFFAFTIVLFKYETWAVVSAWNNFAVLPSNTAGNSGENIILNCTLSSYANSFQEWIEFVTTTDGRRISIDSYIQHPNKHKYDIVGMYDLVINNVSLDDVGTYACYDDWTNAYGYAELLLIESATSCQGGFLTVAEGNDVVLCGASGAGAWPPVINVTFQDVEQNYIVSYNDTTDDMFALNFVITANRTLNNKTLNYSCDTYFPIPTSLPRNTYNRHFSQEAPSFSKNCNENLVMDVQYFSGEIFFKVNEILYSPGYITLEKDTPYLIECISDANPAVSCFILTEVEEEASVNSCFFSVESSTLGRDSCTLTCRVSSNNKETTGALSITFTTFN